MAEDEYTPTTERIADAYCNARAHLFGPPDEWKKRRAEFDRWLAAHDAQVKAAAWDEGYRSGEGNAAASFRAGARIVTDNPHRAAETEAGR